MMQQPQMMAQQMIQQQMMQQEIMQQQIINPGKITISFRTSSTPDFNMFVEPYITIEELNNKFREKIKSFNIKYRDYVLIYNAKKIDNNSQMTLIDYFKSVYYINITVLFS